MNPLYLFNPENDMALARGGATYTPRPNVAAFRRAGRTLPLWYASGGYVLCGGVNDRWYSHLADTFGFRALPWEHQCEISDMQGVPWGWSEAVCGEFQRMGMPQCNLPSDGRLEAWRGLSHRRTCIGLGTFLTAENADVVYDTVEVFDSGGLRDALVRHKGRAVVKAPWSSSGKGIYIIDSPRDMELADPAIRGVIARQGSVTVERQWDVKRDFAMLFVIGKQGMQYRGLSLFDTDSGHRYSGNIVAQPDLLTRLLCIYGITSQRLDVLSSQIGEWLQRTDLHGYCGPVGVDLALTADGAVAPVEINFRNTFGHVAATFAARYLEPDIWAVMDIAPRTPDDWYAHGGKWRGGNLFLTPPDEPVGVRVKSCI